MSAAQLALKGGTPAILKGKYKTLWPHIIDEDLAAVSRTIAAHDLTSLTRDGAVSRLESRWADAVNVGYCVAVANGTDALMIALAAAGVGPGDEVIVPALSFMATAMAPLHLLAVPIFVDVDPISFNIDVAQIAAKITNKTRAIIPVHLHGLPANLDEIIALAATHDLVVIEDAAQAHGASYRGRKVGSVGQIGTFSLNVSKNLPACGEGGLLTTNDAALAERARRLRQFGESLIPGERRTYLHHHIGWNSKMCAAQAAFTLSQHDRFEHYTAIREHNVRALLARLSVLPGLKVPFATDDRSHVWHILRFHIDPAAAGFPELSPGAFRQALERALQAEGVPVGEYQRAPLVAQPVFQRPGQALTGKYGLPPERRSKEYDLNAYPNTFAVIASTFVLQKIHLPPDAANLLKNVADAFEKVFSRVADVAELARISRYSEPWAETIASSNNPIGSET